MASSPSTIGELQYPTPLSTGCVTRKLSDPFPTDTNVLIALLTSDHIDHQRVR